MCEVPGIREVLKDEPQKLDQFVCHLADCVVLTHDKKLLLQRRPENWGSSPGKVNIFGGHVEKDETITEGLIREIKEELGAAPKIEDLKFIGSISEDFTDHTELVHVYFWHDRENKITGCYEAEPIYFENAAQAIAHPKIMEYSVWALKKCLAHDLIP